MKVFIFDASKCNGCYSCQLACKDENVGNEWLPYSKPQPDTGHFWCGIKEITHGQIPKVRVEYRQSVCQHCDDAPCMKAAPDAVYRRDDGLVIIDPVKAQGNKALVDACPYNAIYWNEELTLPQKCTGCAHLVDEGRNPHCVEHCATGAWRFGDEADFKEELADAVRLTNENHGGHVYYRNLPGLFIGGEVWDPAVDEIIEGAVITLLDKDGAIIAQSESDGYGDFWFKGLEAGTYKISIEAKGFQPADKEVDLCKSLNIGDFPLTPLS